MFYKMIETKRDQWYLSPECTVNTLVDYMVKEGHLRDAQIDAIKTYLFLKIGCACKPLWELFSVGKFTSIDLNAEELSTSVRAYLQGNPAAVSLYEYACKKNDAGEQVSEVLERAIKEGPDSIDYSNVFKKLFYDDKPLYLRKNGMKIIQLNNCQNLESEVRCDIKKNRPD